MKFALSLLFFLLINVITSCSIKLKKKVNPIVLTTLEKNDESEIAFATPSTYQATKTKAWDLINTTLEIEPIWNKKEIKGKAILALHPHFYEMDSLVLDAKGMEIISINWKEKLLNFKNNKERLTLYFPTKIKKEEIVQISIEYISKPEAYYSMHPENSNKGVYFIIPEKGETETMQQIWTQGEPESNSIWFPTIDSPNTKSTQDIYITVDSNFVTLSNGKLISQKKLLNGKRIDYWKQEKPHAPYLFMFAIGEFKIIKDKHQLSKDKKIDVNYYVEPQWEKQAKAIFGNTPEMINYFSTLLGVEYPWDKYHQIVVRDYISGAMENTGAVVFGDFVYKNNRELMDGNNDGIISHELFHHWFGDLVTCESWANLSLNESFANYGEYLWNEYKYGKDEADYQLDLSTDQYFQEFDQGNNHDLIWYSYTKPDEMFDRHTYNKGGRILHVLRNYVGDEAFFKSLKKYLTDNQYKSTEIDNLRLAFEEVTGEDLHWFFNQWFFNKGIPQLEINYKISENGKQVSMEINQTQDLSSSPLYTIPLDVFIVDGKGEHIYRKTLQNQKQTFDFPLNGELKAIIFDNSRSFLGYYKENKSANILFNQYYLHKKFISKLEALQNVSSMPHELAEKLIRDGLQDSSWVIRKTAIEKSYSFINENNKEYFNQKIVTISKNDPNSKVRATALQFLLNEKYEGLTDLLKLTFDKDSSYLVQKQALLITQQLDIQKSDEIITGLMKSSDVKTILLVTGVLANSNDSKHLNYFINLFNQNLMKGYDALNLLNNFTYYISSLPLEYQVKALEIFKNQFKNGNFYAKMYLPNNVLYLINSIESTEITDNMKLQLKEMYLKQLKDFYSTIENKN
jgi:aminopeptidase N